MRNVIKSLVVGIGIISTCGYAQVLESSLNLGGANSDLMNDIIKDTEGNIYVTGIYQDDVDFNPNGTAFNLNATTANLDQIFLAKYNSNMILDWVITVGDSAWNSGSYLELDDSLNIYLVGGITGNPDFDPSSNTHYLNGETNSISSFIAKYNKEGEFINAVQIPKMGNTIKNRGDRLFKGPQNTIYAYTGDSLSRMNSNLDLEWKVPISGYPEVFNESEVHCVRYFNLQFHDTTISSFGDIILDKYDLFTGDLVNSTTYGKMESPLVLEKGVVKKTHDNGLLINGMFWGELKLYGLSDSTILENTALVDNGLGGQDPVARQFICKYDYSGELLWVKAYNTDSALPSIIDVDSTGTIYTLGLLNFSANFDPINPVFHTNDGMHHFIAKYDSEFNYQAMSQFLGGSFMERINGFRMYDDTVLICGGFYNSIDIDLTFNDEMMISNGAAKKDGFAMKYSNFNITTNPVSIFEEENMEDGEVYPNPSKGAFMVTFDKESSIEKTIEVMDVNGNRLLLTTSQNNSFQIDLSQYPKAVYFLRVTTDQWISTKKLVTID